MKENVCVQRIIKIENKFNKAKGKVIYGQELPNEESTTTLVKSWGQLSTTCSNATEVAK